MAERSAVISREYQHQERIEWSGLLTTDTGAWVQAAFMADKTIQVSGTPGAGPGSITIEGTNEQTPAAGETIVSVLDDIISNSPLATLAPLAMGLVGENPLFIRPIVISGDGTTNLKVVINATGRRGLG